VNATNLKQGLDQDQQPGSSSSDVGEVKLPALDLTEYIRILWRQKKFVAATMIGVMMIGYLVVASLTPRYTASVLVEISPRQTQVVDFDAVLSGLPGDVETIQTEIQIIQSRKIAQRSITKLDLIWDPEFNSELRPAGVIRSWRRDVAAWLMDSAEEGPAQEPEPTFPSETQAEDRGLVSSGLAWLSRLIYQPAEPTASEEELIRRRDDNLIDVFLGGLSVSPEGRSRVIRISFESENPNTAVAAANAVADFYVVAQLEAKFEATKRATTWLGERVVQLRDEVEVKEQAVEEYRAQSGLLQGGREATLMDEKVSELNVQYVLELANLAEAEARLQQVNRLVRSSGGTDSATEVLESGLIRELRTEEARLEGQIAELSEEYGERHPTFISTRAELRDLRARIQLEIDRVIQGLRNEVSVARARSSALARSLEDVKKDVAISNRREVQLRALEREASASRTLLESLLERTKETASQETFQEADAGILSYASLPKGPSSPKKKLIYPMILVLALLLGLSIAFVVEKFDLGFRSAEQIMQVLGIRSLGLVPSISKIAAMGKPPQEYILENPQSAFGEAVRSLYTNILLSDVVQRPKVLLITSSLPHEGKTTVAVSLARSLATLGQRVLVVDCDMRRSTTHESMKMEAGPGLAECLQEIVGPEEVIQVDEASGAHVLRAGMPHEYSPDQLDSNVMQRLLRNLARRYDLVILDSAPVLAVADTFFLSRLADKTVFLVRWAKTRRESVALSVEQLRAAGANMSGALLTMVDVKSHAQYGYADSGAYHGSLKKYYTD
jgi:capsular exopolysaccharide synthesis family protein